VSKLAAIATQGRVYGIDHSTESVAMARRTNKQWIDMARVEVREVSVSRLPFSDGAFGVITAVEKRTSGGLLCRRICLNF
jgi:ubiquinone/menaquinone biosynthesis C-methylase UbiE